jgi:polysaccharide biosynthesis protein PslG
MRRALVVLAVGLLVPALAAAGAEALPRSFVGLYDEEPEGLTAQAQLGVGIVRQPFDWSRVERSAGVYDWSAYDEYIAHAAAAGVSVMPVLARPPDFRSSRPAHSRSRAVYPPRSNAAYADFVGAAVRRYGPTGSFWRERPDVPFLPVHAWQAWNEPNIPNWWRSGPGARGYVALLRAASRAVRVADPGAEVVAAGLPNSHLGVPFLEYLDAMYRAGARGLFDTLAIHPYSRNVAGLLALAERARALMNRHHDRSRLWITEFGWSTGGDVSAFRVTERGQADRIAGSLSALIAERRALRLRGFVLFRWKDALLSPERERDPWPLHAGLLRVDGAPKPGFWAFSRLVRALRAGWPTASGSAKPTRISHRAVRLSPLGFAPVTVGCRSDAIGACSGVLRLKAARPVACGGRGLPAGAVSDQRASG